MGCLAENHKSQTEFADYLGLFYSAGLRLSSSALFLKLRPVLYSYGCYLVHCCSGNFLFSALPSFRYLCY